MSERRFESSLVKLTRPDKVLFPGDGIRKQDVIDYERFAEVMLPLEALASAEKQRVA